MGNSHKKITKIIHADCRRQHPTQSSSFSPIETSLEVFESEGRYFEGETLAALSGEANTVVDGFIKGVRLHGAELVPLISTYPHTRRQPHSTAVN